MRIAARIAAAAAAFMLVLSLAACGGGGSAEPAGQTEAGASAQADVVGTWDLSGVVDSAGTAHALNEYAAQNGTDISLLQTVFVFNGDGSATISNMGTGLVAGTWELAGDQVSFTAAYEGGEIAMTLTYGAGADGAPALTRDNGDGTVSVYSKVG